MSRNIKIDPFDPTPLRTALDADIGETYNDMSLNGRPGALAMPHTQYAIQQMIYDKASRVINLFRTGNEQVDNIVSGLVQSVVYGSTITLISNFVIKFGDPVIIWKFCSTLVQQIYRLCRTIYRLVFRIIYRNHKTIEWYTKQVDIPFITNNKTVNELYKAVFWYLTNDEEIDYRHEAHLQYICDKKITPGTDILIHQVPSQNKSKKIAFHGYEICYYLSTDLITVYTDKDRKRENYKITLSVKINKQEERDIIEEFTRICAIEYAKSQVSSVWRQQIFTNSNGQWTGRVSNNTRKLETIILEGDLQEQIKQDLKTFLESEEWYTTRDIPYMRGYMLYGEPGTGKTSLIKAISLFCKRHIHYLNLTDVASDAALFDLFGKINYQETVVVIEDIDATINAVRSREAAAPVTGAMDAESGTTASATADSLDGALKMAAILTGKGEPRGGIGSSGNGVTLAGLLNAIDGVQTCHGRILIMTTNHPEMLDTALTRHGRVDAKYHLGKCTRNQVSKLFNLFYGVEPPACEVAQIEDHYYSPAHVSAVFMKYRTTPYLALSHMNDDDMIIQCKGLLQGATEVSDTANKSARC